MKSTYSIRAGVAGPRAGRRCEAQPGGQAMIWYCLDARAAAELHRLSNNALKPVIPE
jgi:hypothetical protein